ncbi:hypothetical protein Tco_0814855 [Tanacetum coccineum]
MLKEHFEGIQTALVKEVKETKGIFKQMEAEVEQQIVMNDVNTVSRFFELHDAYTEEQARYHLNLQFKYQNLKERFGNNKSQTSQDTPEFDTIYEINKMKASLQGKDNAIRKLKEQISQINERRGEANHILNFKALDFQNIELTEKVIITRAKTIEKTTSLLTENEKLKAQLKVKMQCVPMPPVKLKVLTLGMYAIDVEPIPPCNRNNREVHLDYPKHLKESVETLREIVEEARIEKPLDNALENAYFYAKRSQELLEYVIGTCPKEFNKRDKRVVTTPLNMKKFAIHGLCIDDSLVINARRRNNTIYPTVMVIMYHAGAKAESAELSIWKAFGGNTRDLGSFGEETNKTTIHQHLLRISTQKLETASQITRDAVTTHLKMASQDLQTASECLRKLAFVGITVDMSRIT